MKKRDYLLTRVQLVKAYQGRPKKLAVALQNLDRQYFRRANIKGKRYDAIPDFYELVKVIP